LFAATRHPALVRPPFPTVERSDSYHGDYGRCIWFEHEKSSRQAGGRQRASILRQGSKPRAAAYLI
jgi:hypothetical protein